MAAAEKRGVKCSLIDTKDLALEVTSRKTSVPDEVVLQRCVGYFRNVHSTAALEYSGHRVVNSFGCAWTCGNKLFGTLELVRHGVNTPVTTLALSETAALRSAEEIGYPVVLKPVVGSWGRLAALLKDRDAAKAVLEDREHMFPLYQVYYLQKFVNRPPRDVRSFVVGGRVVAAIYRTSSEGEWRTNTALGGRAQACAVTKELEELSLRAAGAVGGEIVGIDLMESKEGLLVHEVNSTTEFKNTVPATGVDIPGLIVEYLASVHKR